ncbi:MAG: acyl-CoA/acyl-ACP dehydrogenase [Burkholderiales bacterium]|nr:acyl-CoA/acyl-ACP dehydrogenase [Burkholderiales bacterium]
MSETRKLLGEAAERLFEKHCGARAMRAADGGEIPQALWRALAEAGYPAALVPESAGGPGLETGDALSLLLGAGRHALPAPLAETMLAGWLLSAAGLALPGAGPLAVAPVREGEALAASRAGAGWRLQGRATRVPWASQAEAIVVAADCEGRNLVALVRPGDCRIERGANVAGESRDDVDFEGVRCVNAGFAAHDAAALRSMGAVMRSAQIAGAMQRVLELSVQYAGERVQFGRPIGRFQAVQQSLAVLAGQAAAAAAAAEAGIEAAARDLASPTVAVAKIRAGEAAGIGAAIAHQVHGAIGFTQEHRLHYWTRRLWSWRDEFGNEARWAARLGGRIAAAGADRLWQGITAAG